MMTVTAISPVPRNPTNAAPLVLGSASINWKEFPPHFTPVPLQGKLTAPDAAQQTVKGSFDDALLAARKLSEQTPGPFSGTLGAVGISQAGEGAFQLRPLSIGNHFPVPLPLAGPGMKSIDTINVTRTSPDLLALVGGTNVAKFGTEDAVTMRF